MGHMLSAFHDTDDASLEPVLRVRVHETEAVD